MGRELTDAMKTAPDFAFTQGLFQKICVLVTKISTLFRKPPIYVLCALED